MEMIKNLLQVIFSLLASVVVFGLAYLLMLMSKEWGSVIAMLLMILAVLNAVVCIFWGFRLIVKDCQARENDEEE